MTNMAHEDTLLALELCAVMAYLDETDPTGERWARALAYARRQSPRLAALLTFARAACERARSV